MTARRTPLRRFGFAVVATLACAAGLACATSTAPAVAANRTGHSDKGTAGYCPTAQGVTVVVDLQQLGGGIIVRCAPGPVKPGFSGLDALEGAGFKPQGVAQWGMAFICRIAGRPAPDERIAIDGDPGYEENCQQTPPTTAFWSYWYADNGGSWTFSQVGCKDRDAIKGGFEGWSFSLNKSQGDAPPPRLKPERPAHRPPHSPPTSPPTHTPTHTPTAPPTSGPPTSHHQPTSPPSSTAPSTAPSTHAPGSTGPTRPLTTGSAHDPTTPGTTGSGPETDPVAVGHNRAGVRVRGSLPIQPSQSSGLSMSVVIGMGVLVVVAVGAGVTGWSRRRR